ncbi:hypothetical protein B0H14DRAFT_3691459 [Mycena olivaceomarginata]|nr:hypothetical protein B0H14DRAFT_3691459 [Mycena olivaceomarginata]
MNSSTASSSSMGVKTHEQLQHHVPRPIVQLIRQQRPLHHACQRHHLERMGAAQMVPLITEIGQMEERSIELCSSLHGFGCGKPNDGHGVGAANVCGLADVAQVRARGVCTAPPLGMWEVEGRQRAYGYQEEVRVRVASLFWAVGRGMDVAAVGHDVVDIGWCAMGGVSRCEAPTSRVGAWMLQVVRAQWAGLLRHQPKRGQNEWETGRQQVVRRRSRGKEGHRQWRVDLQTIGMDEGGAAGTYW